MYNSDLKSVVEDLNLTYLRAFSFDQANVLIHTNSISTIVIDVGFPNVTTEFISNPSGIDNYAIELYVMGKLLTKDPLTEEVDDILKNLKELIPIILSGLNTVSNDIGYQIEFQYSFDDLLVGYKVTATIPYYHVCKN